MVYYYRRVVPEFQLLSKGPLSGSCVAVLGLPPVLPVVLVDLLGLPDVLVGDSGFSVVLNGKFVLPFAATLFRK